MSLLKEEFFKTASKIWNITLTLLTPVALIGSIEMVFGITISITLRSYLGVWFLIGIIYHLCNMGRDKPHNVAMDPAIERERDDLEIALDRLVSNNSGDKDHMPYHEWKALEHARDLLRRIELKRESNERDE